MLKDGMSVLLSVGKIKKILKDRSWTFETRFDTAFEGCRTIGLGHAAALVRYSTASPCVVETCGI